MTDTIRTIFLVYPGITQLDFAGPAQVLARLRNSTISVVAKTREPVPTDSGFAILPSATIDECDGADILCVPGGYGCMGAMEDEALLEWVARVGGEARYVTSVCTRSLILGAAGLLKGYRAACHWMWRDYLRLFGAEPVAERVVFDRNRVTAGGVTSGIDFAFALMAEVRGELHAKAVQLGLEYDPAPPFDAGSPGKAGPELERMLRTHDPEAVADRDRRIRGVADKVGYFEGSTSA